MGVVSAPSSKMLGRASQAVVGGLEAAFQWYGKQVATHPVKVVFACILATGLSVIGILRYTTENNAFRLWIPDNSDFVANYNWLEKNSPPDVRFNSMILANQEDEHGVLTPAGLAELAAIHKEGAELKTRTSSLTWGDVCLQVGLQCQGDECPPFPDFSKCASQPYQPWVDCYPEPWCEYIQDSTRFACLEPSLLEIWGFDFDYANLNQKDILEAVNAETITSKVTGNPVDVRSLLGEITEDSTGKIVKAVATFIQWFGRVNTSAILEDDVSDMGTGELVDAASLEWEAELRDLLLEKRDNLPSGFSSFVNVARGYSDIAGDTISSDAIMMPIGFLIVFVYVTLMLGRLNCVQQRSMLALAGLASIGMTVGFTYGICSAVGLLYGPMHNIIPFLLLGIGIDDMFVIMQCYDNLSPEEMSSPDIPTRVGKTMKRAGVAITVTSLTDFMVFAIGATSVLPALRSFCLWCGVGILAVYFYQATFFTAFLALDCRRIAARRNGICPLFVHAEKTEEEEEEKKKSSGSKMTFGQRTFSHLANLVLSTPGKVIVLVTAATLLGGGIYGTTQLRQEFDATWFLPPTSYLRQWFAANDQHFPSTGERVKIYLTGVDLADEMDSLDHLVSSLTNATDIVSSVDNWWKTLKNSLPKNRSEVTHEIFNKKLTQFLHGPTGFKYRGNFEFTSDLSCGSAAPPTLLSTLTFTHQQLEKSAQYPALVKVKEIIEDSNFSGNVFPLTREYSSWETDEVIVRELVRNLGIALACVFLTTLLLLANFLGSVIVLLCVAVTLVDLCGYMHFWGLTVDVISAVDIIIAIGLCVDYAVHICHAFLTVSGSKRERAHAALVDMGPAVLNGGISTLIAFILLLSSDSYFFLTFFKIFFLTVLFGVWHGLVLLPVLLSLVGPGAYSSARSITDPTPCTTVATLDKDGGHKDGGRRPRGSRGSLISLLSLARVPVLIIVRARLPILPSISAVIKVFLFVEMFYLPYHIFQS